MMSEVAGMAVGVVVGGAIASSFTLHPRARGELGVRLVLGVGIGASSPTRRR